MEGIWLVSYIVLWIAVAVLAVLCLSLLRLVGQLHERIGPAGAMVIDQGPEIGSRLPALLEVGRLRGKFPLEFPGDRDRLLIFVSPNCEACVRLMKSLIPFSRRYRGELDVLLVSHSSDPDGNERFAADARRGDLPYLVSPAFAAAARVTGGPFGIWVDREGTIHAKGIVNHTEHLESLRNARQAGFASLDDYLDRVEEAEAFGQGGHA